MTTSNHEPCFIFICSCTTYNLGPMVLGSKAWTLLFGTKSVQKWFDGMRLNLHSWLLWTALATTKGIASTEQRQQLLQVIHHHFTFLDIFPRLRTFVSQLLSIAVVENQRMVAGPIHQVRHQFDHVMAAFWAATLQLSIINRVIKFPWICWKGNEQKQQHRFPSCSNDG